MVKIFHFNKRTTAFNWHCIWPPFLFRLIRQPQRLEKNGLVFGRTQN